MKTPSTRPHDDKGRRAQTVEAQLHRRDRHRVQFVNPVELRINSEWFWDQFLRPGQVHGGNNGVELLELGLHLQTRDLARLATAIRLVDDIPNARPQVDLHASLFQIFHDRVMEISLRRTIKHP